VLKKESMDKRQSARRRLQDPDLSNKFNESKESHKSFSLPDLEDSMNRINCMNSKNALDPSPNSPLNGATITADSSIKTNIHAVNKKDMNVNYCHAMPVHTHCQYSPFDRASEERVTLRGFLHLGILLLGVNTLRAMLENVRKYGILLAMPAALPFTDLLPFLSFLIILISNLTIAFLLEMLFLRQPSIDQIWGGLCILNGILAIILPVFIVWHYVSHMLVGVAILFTAVVLLMKLASYHLVNCALRAACNTFDSKNIDSIAFKNDSADSSRKSSIEMLSEYPNNITVINLGYFWLAPTLCYQPAYPRSPERRLSYILKRLLELALCVAMMVIVLQQYTHPTLVNAMPHFDARDAIGLFERVLKLSVSSLYIWLLLFYAYFHAYLNAVAEILRFGDRAFYAPWWNAVTLDQYWRFWNRPVYHWMRRHIYIPLKVRGCPSGLAILTVFLLSGVCHEIIIGIAAHTIQLWCLWAFILQIPLIALTKYLHAYAPQASFGNYFFWCAFCIVGQPMCALLYYRAWSTNTSFLFF
jgi:diacylglycerol O-acyltransferase 1